MECNNKDNEGQQATTLSKAALCPPMNRSYLRRQFRLRLNKERDTCPTTCYGQLTSQLIMSVLCLPFFSFSSLVV